MACYVIIRAFGCGAAVEAVEVAPLKLSDHI